MSPEQEKEVLKRLSAVEVEVSRCIRALTNIAQVIGMAGEAEAECGVCGNNPDAMQFCEAEYCPQGKDPKPDDEPEDG
jgi:hypothetical protein